MTPEDQIALIGYAAGLLDTHSTCTLTIDDEDFVLYSVEVEGQNMISTTDLFYLLSATAAR